MKILKMKMMKKMLFLLKKNKEILKNPTKKNLTTKDNLPMKMPIKR